MQPLTGIRILDFTWAQQGPYATVMLSDMGAEIIKVEHREGERGRWAASGQPQPVPYFVAHDRGKNCCVAAAQQPHQRGPPTLEWGSGQENQAQRRCHG